MDEVGYSGKRQMFLLPRNEGTFLTIGAWMVSVRGKTETPENVKCRVTVMKD